jgi:Tol biopolymer transport system component
MGARARVSWACGLCLTGTLFVGGCHGPTEIVQLELVSVEPSRVEGRLRLSPVLKPTLAYLEDIERSPNVQSVTKVTANEDKATQIGAPVVSPVRGDPVLVYWEFYWERGGRWYSRIFKQTVGSPAKTPLTNEKYQDIFPTFTPDGECVIFGSNRTSVNHTLWQVRTIGGGGMTRLTNTQSEDFGPCVSPNGRFLAFSSLAPEAREPHIWTMPADGGLSTQLREGAHPQFSPGDGRRVLFAREDKLTGRSQIWVMNMDGNEETLLTQNVDSDAIHPRWSPDGKWIVFASDEGKDSKERQNFDIWLMTADGARRTQLTTNGSRDDSPCYDAAGEYIYFRSNRGGKWNIWRFKPEPVTSSAGRPAPPE